MDSEEFQRKPSHGNKMKIEYGDVTRPTIEEDCTLLAKNGRVRAVLLVLTSDAFLKKNINFDQFYALDGRSRKNFDIFYHNDIDSSSLKSCLSTVCGTGRVPDGL